jgi:hypothetical protein
VPNAPSAARARVPTHTSPRPRCRCADSRSPSRGRPSSPCRACSCAASRVGRPVARGSQTASTCPAAKRPPPAAVVPAPPTRPPADGARACQRCAARSAQARAGRSGVAKSRRAALWAAATPARAPPAQGASRPPAPTSPATAAVSNPVNPSAGESVPCEQAQEQLQTLTQSGYHLSMCPNAQHNGLATLSAKEWSALPQQVVEEFLARIKNPRVLDAGCGDRCRIPFPPHAFVVGLDDSPEALERNNQVHQKILGDIQTW